MALSKNQIKAISQLKQKKHRYKEGLFIVEGKKSINELLNSNLELEHLYTTNLDDFNSINDKISTITSNDLKKISCLTTPNCALAIFKIPKSKPINTNALVLALDNVRDPGNLGTIIRLCDWYGIKDLICSVGTVDCYNPKTIQSTMGSISRVNITYLDLYSFIETTNTSVFGTYMDGQNIYKTQLPTNGVIVMGNEANGISDQLTSKITSKICIPRFGETQSTESLNVANATAIILSEFKRAIVQ